MLLYGAEDEDILDSDEEKTQSVDEGRDFVFSAQNRGCVCIGGILKLLLYSPLISLCTPKERHTLLNI